MDGVIVRVRVFARLRKANGERQLVWCGDGDVITSPESKIARADM